MNLKLLSGLAALALLMACGDDTGTGGGGTAGNPGNGGGGSTGNGGNPGTGGGGAPAVDCAAVCGSLYDCGVEDGNCPNFTGEADQKTAFVTNCTSACEGNPALASLVDPDNCSGTVATLSAVNADFKASCSGTGTGGAGGGTGGAGGAAGGGGGGG